MTIKSIWLRKIHKWVGLVIGLQFLVWAISGTAMALLDMDEVAGGEKAAPVPAAPPSANSLAWTTVRNALGAAPVESLRLRPLAGRTVIEVGTGGQTRLFDAATGKTVIIDEAAARAIAEDAHPEGARAASAVPLRELSLAVREHELPIWQVDFKDEKNSSYFVSATTGHLLERRNDTWRWWDFFWMLHNMDYSNRTSFNHPLIVFVGFAMAWLAVTGFWLLFRTMWRHDPSTVRSWLRKA
ncbi:MAG: PepSY domain-containing protein [Alphaproteobacteria bacterium]